MLPISGASPPAVPDMPDTARHEGFRLSRLPSLTGLRWAAAVLVFGQHMLEHYFASRFAMPKELESALWYGLKEAGAWGVTFFFVLSGFVLTWSARPTDTPTAFIRRRLAKIYPNHFVTTILAIGLALYTGLGVTPGQIAYHLTLTQVWQPDVQITYALNGLSWSLGAELFFYVSFPFVLPWLRRLTTTHLRVAMVALPVIVIGYNAAFLAGSDRACVEWLTYFWPAPRLFEFVLGITIALLVQAGAWRGPNLRTATALLVGALLAAPSLPHTLSRGPAVIVPVMLLIPAAARADVAGVRTLWSRPGVVFLGEISFAFYMIHFLVIRTASESGVLPARASVGAALLVTPVLFAVSLALAIALFYGVERPMMRLLAPRRAVARPGAHQRQAKTRPAGSWRPAAAFYTAALVIVAAAPFAYAACVRSHDPQPIRAVLHPPAASRGNIDGQ